MKIMLFNKSTIVAAVLLSLCLFVSCEGPGGSAKNDTFKDSAKSKGPDTSKAQDPIDIEDKYSSIDFYLENSGSMDGYVSKKTEFSDILKGVLYNLETDSINLFYANQNLIPIEKDVKKFIQELTPSNFKSEGGKRESTDIAELLEKIQPNINLNGVTIIASDFIFSPGKGKNATEYLSDQQLEIKRIVKKIIDKGSEMSMMVCRFESKFTGCYYNREDSCIDVKDMDRPFYIWFIGTKRHLITVRNRLYNGKIPKKNVAFYTKENLDSVNWRIKNGQTYSISRSSNHALENLRKNERNGKCEFKISANLSLLVDDEYILNPNNYEVTNNYSVSKIVKESDSYVISLESDKVYKGSVVVSLKSQIPNWIEAYTDHEGIDVKTASDKTYGLSYLLNGVSDAFNQSILVRFNVQIN